MAASVPSSLQSPQDVQLNIIDPDGDITLIIPVKRTDAEKQRSGTSVHPRQFKVSSKHLTFASPYFKARLSANWPEGKDFTEKGSAEISIDGPGCDPETLSIILHIFHALGRHVPKQVTAERLLNIALATDYLQCHAAVEDYGRRWAETLNPSLPRAYDMETKDWILISYTFRWQELFQTTTTLAQRHGQGPLDTGGLPIPKLVKDEIDQKRKKFLDKAFTLLDEHELRLRDGAPICNVDCDAFHLGMLIKKRSKYQGGEQPHLGYSPSSLVVDTKSWRHASKHCSVEEVDHSPSGPFGTQNPAPSSRLFGSHSPGPGSIFGGQNFAQSSGNSDTQRAARFGPPVSDQEKTWPVRSPPVCGHRYNLVGFKAHTHLGTMEDGLRGLQLTLEEQQASV